MARDPVADIIGNSAAVETLKDKIRQVARHDDTTVLILGESGTGKELVSRSIHKLSGRRARAFVAVDCAAIAETLLESAFFGHERGAFTGAATRCIGKFEQADGGTIFLDEVGELALALQAKLLRVLQERRFQRLGGMEAVEVDVRVVAATNRDLVQMCKDGAFRQDLLYRLNVFPIRVPPLRERRADVILLARHFLSLKSQENSREDVELSSDVVELLVAYDWPGNVRELQNMVERMYVRLPGDASIVTLDTLSADDRRCLASQASDAAGVAQMPSAGLDPSRYDSLLSERRRTIFDETVSQYQHHAATDPEVRASRVYAGVKTAVGLNRASDGIKDRTQLLRVIFNHAVSDEAFEGVSSETCRAIACDIERWVGKTKVPNALRRAAEGGDRPRTNISTRSSQVLPHPHRGLVEHLLEVACGGGDNHRCIPASPGLLLDRAFRDLEERLRIEGVSVIDIHADRSSSVQTLLETIVDELLEGGFLTSPPRSAPTANWIKNRVAVRRPRCMVLLRDIDFTLTALPASESRGELVRALCRMNLPVVFTSMRPVREWCMVEGVASALELHDVPWSLVADDWDGFVDSYELDAATRARFRSRSGGSPQLFDAMVRAEDIDRLRQGFAHDIWTRLPAFRHALFLAAAGRGAEMDSRAGKILRWARVLDPRPDAALLADPELGTLWQSWAAGGVAGRHPDGAR